MSSRFIATEAKPSLVPGLEHTFYARSISADLEIIGCYCTDDECTCEDEECTCADDNGTCEDVTLYFHTAGSCYRDRLFKIVVNYTNWALVSTEIYNDDLDCTKIIHEFMDGLNDRVKSMIVAGKEKTSSDDSHVLHSDIDYTGMTIDSMMGYLNIFDAEPYEVFNFEYDKTQYLVLDYYCVDPQCACMNVLLAFLVIRNQRAVGAPAVEFFVDFKNGERTVQSLSDGTSTQDAEALFAEFEAMLERQFVEPLVERYYRMKKWGKEVLASKLGIDVTQTTAKSEKTGKTEKIGRNDPCPCGSGKKYKKCCGA